jgi:hypothetical protein
MIFSRLIVFQKAPPNPNSHFRGLVRRLNVSLLVIAVRPYEPPVVREKKSPGSQLFQPSWGLPVDEPV